jgi:hypothetical protein
MTFRPVYLALLALLGCSPSLNWREVRLEGPNLVAMFPCRPVAQTRDLQLAGRALSPKLDACESAGSTFAVMAVDVKDPAVVDEVLQALRDTSFAKLAASAGASSAQTGWRVAGMTPQPAAGRWSLTRPGSGQAAVRMDTAVFARGTWVIQVSVIGPVAVAEGAVEPFFEGLAFAP